VKGEGFSLPITTTQDIDALASNAKRAAQYSIPSLLMPGARGSFGFGTPTAFAWSLLRHMTFNER